MACYTLGQSAVKSDWLELPNSRVLWVIIPMVKGLHK